MSNSINADPKSEKSPGEHMTYSDAGVKSGEDLGLKGVLEAVRSTFSFRSGPGRPVLDLGYFANVLDLGSNLGLAIATDGVGTKVLIAEMLGKYDTIGIDCVAMNANDVLCVGAEPISLVDYIAVEEARPEVLEEIAKGLREGARLSGINIPGGEVAQVPELIRGAREGLGCDLVGTCVGLVRLDEIVDGRDLKPGDAVIGLRSSGIHSNGLTLARKALFGRVGYGLSDYVPELGRSIGEELLEPTRIYVSEMTALLKSDVHVKALAHITGDGLLNLARVAADVGFEIDHLPEPQPIFELIQKAGDVEIEEMYRVFNMGIGFCAVVAPEDADKAVAIIESFGAECWPLGRAVADPQKRIRLPQLGLVSEGDSFARYRS